MRRRVVAPAIASTAARSKMPVYHSDHMAGGGLFSGFVLVILLMMREMKLSGFAGMMRGVQMVPLRDLRMVRGHMMIRVLVVLSGVTVMHCGLLVVVGSLLMMLGGLARVIHDRSSTLTDGLSATPLIRRFGCSRAKASMTLA